MAKKCKFCNSYAVIKKGKHRGKQRYFCKNCLKKFVNKSRKKISLERKVVMEYIFKRRLLKDISDKFNLSKTKVREILLSFSLKEKTHRPRGVHILVDAIWFGKRRSKYSFCIIVFRDFKRKENLYWSVEDSETKIAYLKGKVYLESLGYRILSVTGDGFAGIRQAFKGIPYQMCQVHMERIVLRQTTRNPQTEAGQVLLALIKTIHKTNKETFFRRLKYFTLKYNDFLNEKSINPNTGKKFYTHKRVRSAWKSILFFSEYLFTYNKDNEINKNTNSLEGHFGHIRDYLNIHRGLSKEMKIKFLYIIFHASSVSPDKEKLNKIV